MVTRIRARETTLVLGAATDPGPAREQNEDAVLVVDPASPEVQENGVLLAVADGMGGYRGGEIAAQLAVEVLRDRFYASPIGPADVAKRLEHAVREANERIFREWESQGEEQLMGTTLVAAVIRGESLTVANVGDSRAYLIRAKRPTQITRDHSLVAEHVEAGLLSREEARGSSYRNVITRALGYRSKVDVDIFELRLMSDDRIVLTTDGVHDVLSDEELAAIVLAAEPERAARSLVEQALARGTHDNASAIVAWLKPAVLPDEDRTRTDEQSNRWIVVLIVVGLLVFVAIIGIIVMLGSTG
ncbi:MAG: protein phosphatase 2C domain-containing protein [Thermomicrobium sp.]|nr:protein phosphatase 2C domain-containing protein [Thermomicrobium sp.]MCS7246271.1 protein phosphatase 2C domain-containing protein [Thermomicrobium sp.]MDW7982274.1 protein phosphatase 2C domain-containing protein [Thermomicrobium sp.]